MRRYVLCYCALLPSGERIWYPASSWRILGVAEVVWKTRPLPRGYSARVLAEFDPFQGWRVVFQEGAYALTGLEIDQERRIDLAEPMLGEALLYAMPDQWRKEWPVPADPLNPQATEIV